MGVSPHQVLKMTIVPGGAMLGVDIMDPSTWDILTQHPVQQLGCAAIDAGTGYGIYKIGANQGWWGGSGNTSSSSTTAPITINGNQNTVNSGSGQININHQQPMSNGDGPGVITGGDAKP